MDNKLKNQISFFIESANLESKFQDCRDINKAIEKAYELGYNDAKRTLTNIGKHNDKKKSAQEKIIASIIKYFEESLSFPETQEEFDKKHDKWCKIWCDELSNDSNLNTYGKAQKIINMTFKYLYCWNTISEENKINDNAFKFCHMALDHFIIDWINSNLESKDIIKTKWSNLSKEEYKNIRDKIPEKKELSKYAQLEAEFFIWDYQQFHENYDNFTKFIKKFGGHNDVKKKIEDTEKYLEELKKEFDNYFNFCVPQK